MPKNIVLIGGSKGIGKAIVQTWLNQSNEVIIHSFSRSKSGITHKNLIEYSIDLTSKTFKDDFQKQVKNIGEVSVLINNAGALINKPFLELTREDIEQCYSVNVFSVIETIQVLLPKMTADGHIVQISSMGGIQGTMKFAGLTAYSTSKAAVISVTELLAEEFKGTGIKINCLCLGAVETEMFKEAFPQFKAPLLPDQMAEYIIEFAQNGHKFMHGRIIPVSLTTP